MISQHHTCEEKKEKHISDSLLLHRRHYLITQKELIEVILMSL
jgi:hypothetical protein